MNNIRECDRHGFHAGQICPKCPPKAFQAVVDAIASERKQAASASEAGNRANTAECRFTVPGAPVGKPRMTRSDVWKKRPAVMRYRAWADTAREAAYAMMPARLFPSDPLSVSWIAFFELPASWSAKKKAAMRGQFHRQKPDRDNVDKALLDALWKDDSGIAHGTLEKLWDDGAGPRLEVTIR